MEEQKQQEVQFLYELLKRCNSLTIECFLKGKALPLSIRKRGIDKVSVVKMNEMQFEDFKNNIFIFKVRDVNSKFIIGAEEIESIVPLYQEHAIKIEMDEDEQVSFEVSKTYSKVQKILIVLIDGMHVEISFKTSTIAKKQNEPH
ncbi:MAG: hypothetical protein PVI88_00335 [Nitrosopumilaceae archaeon]|jgi:hypothetical protein